MMRFSPYWLVCGIRVLVVLWAVMAPRLVRATAVAAEEMGEARRWAAARFEKPEPPFSFTYGGQPSAELLKAWKLDRKTHKLDQQRTEHTLSYTDPKTGLVVRCVVVEYHDFPTVEWTLYFKNTGTADTPILENIQALDSSFECRSWSPRNYKFILHHFAGGFSEQDAYQPFKTRMIPRSGYNLYHEKSFAGRNGRPTNQDMPYFNIEGGGEGVIVVIGWPGQWSAQFRCESATKMHVVAGQELTHFLLHPDEEVRTPRIVLQFWKGGDWIDSQNVWRRWMMAHNMPKPGGKLPPPMLFGGGHVGGNEKTQIALLNDYIGADPQIDCWWKDAGWYFDGSWGNTGRLEFDKKLFPEGFKRISALAHSKGIKTMLWFEPERVVDRTCWQAKNHPEWLLGSLFNLGNPEARRWLTDHIDKLMTEQGIDFYRQDFNFDPLDSWRRNDAKDGPKGNRQGITEIKYVTGYLAYWDELIRRRPNMLIDSCASGGRRNDLETLRRAVPLWRTDYSEWEEPVGEQCQTYGISFWIPYHGGGNSFPEPYRFWSLCRPSIVQRRGSSAALCRLNSQWRKISPYYYGDFYPLTSYSLEKTDWMAWQFNKPDLGEGMVQAFRRAESPDESACYKLRGLDPESRYIVTDLDKTKPLQMSGRELMHNGLPIGIQAKPGAVVLTYKCVK